MDTLSRKFPIYLVASTILITTAGASYAAGACNVQTARQSGASAQVLCECDSVTTGMIRYIQRRADFDKIVARLGAECSPLAALLTDLPTASTGFTDTRSGDGPADETNDDGGLGDLGTPTRTNTPTTDNNPPSSDNPPNDDDPQDDPEEDDGWVEPHNPNYDYPGDGIGRR